MKLLYLILLVWICPGLLLFLYLAWKNQLISRYVGSLNSRTDAPPLGDVDQEASPAE